MYRPFRELKDSFKRFLKECQPRNGDVVAFATSSDFELLAFGSAVRELSFSSAAKFIFYLHFGIFESARTSKLIPVDARRRMFGKVFRTGLDLLSGLNCKLCATSPGVAELVENCIDKVCQYVPYPIFHSQESPSRSRTLDSGRIRIAVAGVSRAEQLGTSLDSLFAQLAKRPVLSAGLEIAVRGTSDSLRICEQRFRKMLELSDGQCQSVGPYLITTDYKNSDVSEYRGWLADSDIGLFLYDRDAYRHRASGMFLEMLSLGIP